jgi:hypothetical protein
LRDTQGAVRDNDVSNWVCCVSTRRRARPRRRTPSAPVTSLGVQPAALAHGPAPARAGRGMGRFALAHAPDVRSPAASRLGSQGASGGRLRRRRTFVRLSPTRRSAAALLRGTRSPAEGAEHATIARRGKACRSGAFGGGARRARTVDLLLAESTNAAAVSCDPSVERRSKGASGARRVPAGPEIAGCRTLLLPPPLPHHETWTVFDGGRSGRSTARGEAPVVRRRSVRRSVW